MKQTVYKSYDELPLMLSVSEVAAALRRYGAPPKLFLRKNMCLS